MRAPTIKPMKLKEHTCKQLPYSDTVLKLPMGNMLVAPSGAGNTMRLTNTIPDMYKSCFSRPSTWSPPIDVDNTWKPIKDYI